METEVRFDLTIYDDLPTPYVTVFSETSLTVSAQFMLYPEGAWRRPPHTPRGRNVSLSVRTPHEARVRLSNALLAEWRAWVAANPVKYERLLTRERKRWAKANIADTRQRCLSAEIKYFNLAKRLQLCEAWR